MPTLISSSEESDARFAIESLTVNVPASPFGIATPVMSGAWLVSPEASLNDPEFAANAAPTKTNAATTAAVVARRIDPFIGGRIAHTVHAAEIRQTSPRRRRRLPRTPRV